MRLTYLMAALVATPLCAQTPPCDNRLFTVETQDVALGQKLCEQSDAALTMLTRCGLPMPTPLRVRIVQAFETDCIGLFHCGQSLIELLAYEPMQARQSEFALFVDIPPTTFQASILMHEVAHAVLEKMPCPDGNCLVTEEYFAYGLQILSLPETDRARISAMIPDAGDDHHAYLNSFILLMAPEKFALRAWADLSRQPDPCVRLRRIAAGDLSFDRDED